LRSVVLGLRADPREKAAGQQSRPGSLCTLDLPKLRTLVFDHGGNENGLQWKFSLPSLQGLLVTFVCCTLAV
jgi:hypothetical protein